MTMRVLLLGTSYSSLPLLRELQLLNCEVIACGKYPDDPCHLYADKSVYVDYSDFEAVYSAVKDYSINAVVPS